VSWVSESERRRRRVPVVRILVLDLRIVLVLLVPSVLTTEMSSEERRGRVRKGRGE
jgi:hypothetical protein